MTHLYNREVPKVRISMIWRNIKKFGLAHPNRKWRTTYNGSAVADFSFVGLFQDHNRFLHIICYEKPLELNYFSESSEVLRGLLKLFPWFLTLSLDLAPHLRLFRLSQNHSYHHHYIIITTLNLNNASSLLILKKIITEKFLKKSRSTNRKSLMTLIGVQILSPQSLRYKRELVTHK